VCRQSTAGDSTELAPVRKVIEGGRLLVGGGFISDHRIRKTGHLEDSRTCRQDDREIRSMRPEGEEAEGVTAHGDHDAVRSRSAAALEVVPDYTIWSQINVDEVHPWEGGGPTVQLGGAASYGALGARLVCPPDRIVKVIGSVGADFEARFWQWFEDRNIDTSGVERRSERTPRSKLVYGPNGDRVEYPLLGLEHFRQFSRDVPDLATVNLRCRGLYVFREAQREFWEELASALNISGAKVLWEIDRRSCRPACWADVSAIMRNIDVFSINQTEAALLVGCDDVEECLEALRSAFEGVLLYRMGTNGSYVVEGSRVLRVSAVAPRRTVDPTGAGNAYGGAFLAAWCEDFGNLEGACRLAAGVAGLVAGARGLPSDSKGQLVLEAQELAGRTEVKDFSLIDETPAASAAGCDHQEESQCVPTQTSRRSV
jgi:sugar/nucleoside kinase (ribokinase family)